MTAPTREPSYPAPQTASRGRNFTIAGGICAVLALIFLPPVLGLAGLVLGIVGYKMKDRAGLYVAIASVLCAGLGLVIGAAVISAVRH
jgi:hypothetical protein